MKRDWSTEEIIEHFTLLPADIAFLGNNDPHNHLGKALLLKFFEYEGKCQQRILLANYAAPRNRAKCGTRVAARSLPISHS